MSSPGAIGALILVALFPFYVHRCLRGPTRPHPVSWGIWALLAIVGAASNGAAGGGEAVIVLYLMVAMDICIFVVALRNDSRSTTLAETWPLLPAAVGAAVWIGAQTPLAAAVGVVVADSCAFVPTVVKTWRDPTSEPPLLWLMDSIAFALACCGVSTVGVASLLYPVYLTVSTLLLAVIAWSTI